MTPVLEQDSAVGHTDLKLKDIREAKGVSLKDIFQATRITTVNLEAIEEGRFHLLPEPVYARTFIKAYAKFLGIDCLPILERYDYYLKSLAAAVAPEMDQARDEGASGRSFPQRRSLIWVLILGLVLIVMASGLYYGFHRETDMLRVAPTQIADKTPAVVTELPKTAPSPAVETQPVPNIQTPAPEKRYHLVIRISEKTWLRIQEDQNTPQELLLNKGDALERFANDSLSLVVGNAGGVEMSFQGKSLGKIGNKGQVVHLRFP